MSDFLENNEELLNDLKNDEVSNVEGTVGSFFMCLFEEEHHDCIPLFFGFLSYKTGKDYSAEIEWVQECLKEGKEAFEKLDNVFNKIGDERALGLMALLMAMSDD